MRNFDQERKERRLPQDERTFVLAGETFVAKGSVHPEVLAGWDELGADTSVEDTLKIIDQLVHDAIEPWDDAHERWDAARGRTDDDETGGPINLDDLLELCKWLIETQTGRPTGQPDDSTGPLGTNGTRSTESSSSPALSAA